VLFSMALAHVSEYRPFADLVRSALRRELELELAGMPEQLDRAGDAAGRLEPFPDAAAALDVLASAGCRLGVLTNSEGSAAEGNLTRVGWRDRFERVVGTEQVRAYKPRPSCIAGRSRSSRRRPMKSGSSPPTAGTRSARGMRG